MREAPLLVAVPEDLRLPGFWRLPETPTRQVRAFSDARAIASASVGSSSAPLYF